MLCSIQTSFRTVSTCTMFRPVRHYSMANLVMVTQPDNYASHCGCKLVAMNTRHYMDNNITPKYVLNITLKTLQREQCHCSFSSLSMFSGTNTLCGTTRCIWSNGSSAHDWPSIHCKHILSGGF